MSTDSNIPILGRIAAAIHPDEKNYANERDYYGSPVNMALERALDDHSWPYVRREYLLDEEDRLTKFPHNEGLSNAEERDLPATFFYEVIQLTHGVKIGNRDFSTECVRYYDSQGKNEEGKNDIRSEKAMRDHARRMFFNCYAFILCQEIVKNEITVDQLKSAFNDPPPNDGIEEAQHNFYIDKIYKIYCEKRGVFDTKIPRFNDYSCKEFNRKPVLSGPIFMTKIFELNFASNSKGTYLKVDRNIDFSNVENGTTSKLDFENRGGKNAAALFVFCATAERVFLEKKCCDPLAKVEEIIQNAKETSNYLLGAAIMPNLQQALDKVVEELTKAIHDERNGRTTRFEASSLFNDIQAFINDTNPDEPDGVDECGSLHIVIPNDSRSLPEDVIELKFHFFDMNKRELSFHYIESYDCKDQSEKPSDGYYFMPGSDNSLSEIDYLSCAVKVGTALDPNDETTAHVVAVLYQP